MTVAKQRLAKYFSTATSTHPTVKELLGAVCVYAVLVLSNTKYVMKGK
jgi:hypothetical protein